ncbi:hypothetical protein BDL97_07G123300 [Sphagnum fallax]|nr:hypothetical protein BDL97_07G123300 [Sphagnum fallax]
MISSPRSRRTFYLRQTLVSSLQARGRGAGQSGREDEQAGWGVQHERVVNTTLRVGSHWARGKGGLG